jgi:ABC-type glycerol-3-phosphate transport system substrate-binding protein
VKFKWTALPYDRLHERALTALASGVPEGLPSIIRTSMSYYRAFANSGALEDLTDKVRPYREDVLPSVWDGVFVNDKIYQVPDDTGVTLFGYRWDLFEKAGLPSEPGEVADLLATYDDLIEAGRTLQESIGAKLFNYPPGSAVFDQLIRQDSTGISTRTEMSYLTPSTMSRPPTSPRSCGTLTCSPTLVKMSRCGRLTTTTSS